MSNSSEHLTFDLGSSDTLKIKLPVDYCMNEIGKAILEAGLELGHSKTDVVLQESQIPTTAFRVALRQEGDVYSYDCA
jgi:hypothetical protein